MLKVNNMENEFKEIVEFIENKKNKSIIDTHIIKIYTGYFVVMIFLKIDLSVKSIFINTYYVFFHILF